VDEAHHRHLQRWGGAGGNVSIQYRPVHEYTLTDEIDYIKPKARVY
jgi:succinate dehydrogenase / fumarate reductase flavoprotein subunit